MTYKTKKEKLLYMTSMKKFVNVVTTLSDYELDVHV